MKAFLLCLTFITPLALSARNDEVAEIGRRLADAGCYRADARFEVLQPNSDVPVVYDLRLTSMPAGGDTLSVCDYLIDWTLHTPAGTTSAGFSAYASGNHYRYRDGRLQEYHVADNAAPFAPGGCVDKGVQALAQFVEYLPQAMGRRLIAMASDTTFVMTVDRRSDRVTVSGIERVRGYDCREFSYRFDSATGLPVEIEIDANPGMPSEQIMTIEYASPQPADCQPIDEPMLIARYPGIFERYRRDSYSLLSLPGGRMPAFEARVAGGGRYAHTSGEPLQAVTVFAVLDSGVGHTAEVVEALRRAESQSPVPFDLVLAFIDNDAESIGDIVGET
ncbi:MAG: hypothetical protein Q4C34_09720, partial [Bacteroidales bacterium]|nr:hypothetical protein [Bacteroidales bacterium]